MEIEPLYWHLCLQNRAPMIARDWVKQVGPFQRREGYTSLQFKTHKKKTQPTMVITSLLPPANIILSLGENCQPIFHSEVIFKISNTIMVQVHTKQHGCSKALAQNPESTRCPDLNALFSGQCGMSGQSSWESRAQSCSYLPGSSELLIC